MTPVAAAVGESKKVCLVQLSLVYGGVLDRSVFSKKVRICGFPLSDNASSVAYVKEINYPPQQATLSDNRQSCRLNHRLLADLLYPHIDLDLAKSLEKFDYIIVNNADTAAFIHHYIKQATIIINIDAVVGSTPQNNAGMSECTPRSSRIVNHIHHI
jgi:hypothetical protein